MDFFRTLYVHLETTRQFVASVLSTPLGVIMHCNLYLFLVVNNLEYKETTHTQQYYVVPGFDTEGIFPDLICAVH